MVVVVLSFMCDSIGTAFMFSGGLHWAHTHSEDWGH